MCQNSKKDSTTASRSLRSNTDRTQDRISQIVQAADEIKKKAKSQKPSSIQFLSVIEEEGIIQITSTSQSAAEVEGCRSSQTQSQTTIPWDISFAQELEDDYFSEVICIQPPSIPIVYRPCTMDDLRDDQADLKDNVDAIQVMLDYHDPAAPAVPVPMTLAQVKMEIDDLNSMKSKVDDLKPRTRRLLRGSADAVINAALAEAKLTQIKINRLEQKTHFWNRWQKNICTSCRTGRNGQLQNQTLRLVNWSLSRMNPSPPRNGRWEEFIPSILAKTEKFELSLFEPLQSR